jgi:eukaryotic-like serine/threonine-protein kinase
VEEWSPMSSSGRTSPGQARLSADPGTDADGLDQIAPIELASPKSRPSSVRAVRTGAILGGKYRIERVLGQGTMGIVFAARHIGDGTEVAIKLLFSEFMSYAEAAHRFTREARAAGTLTSDHVAHVIEVGTIASGEPYIVMEYLDGEDLAAARRDKPPLAIGQAIDFIAQACDAIAEAHGLGIVHRDLKPANLFLTHGADGAPLVKVLDFGISKILGEAGQGQEVALTKTTTILGSALYMSPEQMQSAKRTDHRTDLYALCVCLYELIGGDLPYFAETFPELCALVYTSPPRPLRELRPEVPEGLVKVIERGLAREASRRHQSVGELVRALSPYAEPATRARMRSLLDRHAPDVDMQPRAPAEEEAGAPAPPRRRTARRVALAALLLLVLGPAAAVLRPTIEARLKKAIGGSPPRGEATAIAPAGAPPTAVVPAAETAKAGPAAPAASATPPAETGKAPEAGASAVPPASAAPAASAGAGAPPAAGSARTGASGAAGHAPPSRRTSPEAEPLVDAPRGDLPGTPRATVNGDLSIEHCFVTQPDGTRKETTCP